MTWRLDFLLWRIVPGSRAPKPATPYCLRDPEPSLWCYGLGNYVQLSPMIATALGAEVVTLKES